MEPGSIYGPYFELGKLAQGHYQVYDSSVSTKSVYSFSVSSTGTTNIQPDKGITNRAKHEASTISISARRMTTRYDLQGKKINEMNSISRTGIIIIKNHDNTCKKMLLNSGS